ncbi:uncharacterized protein [Dermacentor albipictus]|uniref:uncharacterized protein n=1 Tax=Dermacentor albipictus TaxID=60249 RepID=UPI0038FC513E
MRLCAVPATGSVQRSAVLMDEVSDQNNDRIYECLTAKRAWLKPEEKKGEYIWFFGGHGGTPKRTVGFYVSEGSSPDTFRFSVDQDDSPSEEAKFYYTDYDNCAVLDIPYNGRQCILWTKETVKDSVPQKCMDAFMKNCGVGAPLYNDDLCSGDEVAEW